MPSLPHGHSIRNAPGFAFGSTRATSLEVQSPRTHGIADRLDNGVWTAEINAGQGLRHAPATFTATH